MFIHLLSHIWQRTAVERDKKSYFYIFFYIFLHLLIYVVDLCLFLSHLTAKHRDFYFVFYPGFSPNFVEEEQNLISVLVDFLIYVSLGTS